MKKSISLFAFGLVAIMAGTAHAATYSAVVSDFRVRDGALGPASWGADKVLLITFTTNANVCGNGTQLMLSKSSSDQWDNWIKVVTSAYLSGRKLAIDTYQPGGTSTCRVVAVGLAQ